MKRSRIRTKFDPDQSAREGHVRQAVIDRDRGCMLRGLTGHACLGRLTFHHRRKASAGGAYTVANGAALCCACNGYVEDAPALVRGNWPGLVVREGDLEWEALSARAARKSCPPCQGTRFAVEGGPCPDCTQPDQGST